jgi:hypothetical protein
VIRSRKRIVQPHIPGLARADKAPVEQKIKESALVTQIRGTLANAGYTTFVVGEARAKVKCPAEGCGEVFYPTGYAGNTPGTPDLLAFSNRADFPPVAFLIEVKTSKGKVREKQQVLADSGRSYIVRSCSDAVEAVRDAESRLTRYSTPERHIERLEAFETL